MTEQSYLQWHQSYACYTGLWLRIQPSPRPKKRCCYGVRTCHISCNDHLSSERIHALSYRLHLRCHTKSQPSFVDIAWHGNAEYCPLHLGRLQGKYRHYWYYDQRIDNHRLHSLQALHKQSLQVCCCYHRSPAAYWY